MKKITERFRQFYGKHTPSVKLPMVAAALIFCMIPLLIQSRVLSSSSRQQQIDRLTDEEAAQIAAGEPADWVKETHEICKEIYGFTPEGTDISYDYLFKYTPVVERQFLRGGHRLARLLNEIYR